MYCLVGLDAINNSPDYALPVHIGQVWFGSTRCRTGVQLHNSQGVSDVKSIDLNTVMLALCALALCIMLSLRLVIHVDGSFLPWDLQSGILLDRVGNDYQIVHTNVVGPHQPIVVTGAHGSFS